MKEKAGERLVQPTGSLYDDLDGRETPRDGLKEGRDQGVPHLIVLHRPTPVVTNADTGEPLASRRTGAGSRRGGEAAGPLEGACDILGGVEGVHTPFPLHPAIPEAEMPVRRVPNGRHSKVREGVPLVLDEDDGGWYCWQRNVGDGFVLVDEGEEGLRWGWEKGDGGLTTMRGARHGEEEEKGGRVIEESRGVE